MTPQQMRDEADERAARQSPRGLDADQYAAQVGQHMEAMTREEFIEAMEDADHRIYGGA